MPDCQSGDNKFKDSWIIYRRPPKDGLGRWWAKFRNVKIAFLYERIQKIIKAHHKKKIRIYEHGCGTGRNLIVLSSLISSQRKNIQWFGSDISIRAIEIAKEFSQKAGKNIVFFVSDASDVENHLSHPEHGADIIFSSDLLGHVPDLKAVADCAFKMLNPGGWYIAFSESDGHLRNSDYWCYKVVEKLGYDPFAAEEFHINLLSPEKISDIFIKIGFKEVFRKPISHFPIFRLLGVSDISNMVSKWPSKATMFVRISWLTGKIAKWTRSSYALRLAEMVMFKLNRYSYKDSGGVFFLFQKL
ncbi:MAG: class I SAM-dependent methyltransferase [Planctomycetota bacterium]